MASCIMGLIKYMIFIVNFAFALTGLTLLVVGVVIVMDINDVTDAIDAPAVQAAPILMIIIGSTVFIIAFFGCCGACQKSRCMLLIYAMALFVLFALQIGLGAYVLCVKGDEDLQSEITKDLMHSMEKYEEGKGSAEAYDLLQTTLDCCGVITPLDWSVYGKPIPQSCYAKNAVLPYVHGCSKELYDFIHDNMNIIAGVLLGLSVFELVTAILTLCVRSDYK